MRILFWLALVFVGWLGLRNLITIFTRVKPYTRPCYAIEFVLYTGGSVTAIILDSWWPLLIGAFSAYSFHHFVIWSGKIARQRVDEIDDSEEKRAAETYYWGKQREERSEEDEEKQ